MMPTREQILQGLSAIARNEAGTAIAWHAVIAVVIIALLAGFRPDRRVATLWLCLPLISVAAFAWAYQNLFNGAVFVLLTATIATAGLLTARDTVRGGVPR